MPVLMKVRFFNMFFAKRLDAPFDILFCVFFEIIIVS